MPEVIVGKRLTDISVLGLPAACLAATCYAFVPSGAVAFALAAGALAVRDRRAAARLRQNARTWLIATLLIGAAVEAPVIAAALS